MHGLLSSRLSMTASPSRLAPAQAIRILLLIAAASIGASAACAAATAGVDAVPAADTAPIANTSSIANTESTGNAEGFAYSEDGSKLLYTEVHRWQGVAHTVEYFRPDGKLVSINELDSSSSFVSPIYKQHYSDSNFTEGARWRDSDLVLFSGSKEKVVEYQPPLVMSSGFYHFILEHYRELQAGQSIPFDFAVPSLFSTIRLRMHALINTGEGSKVGGKDGGAAGPVKDADPNWFYVRVEVANSLLRWLVHPLTVALDNQQRLVLYRGISNVRDANGDTPQVLIRYRYPTTALRSHEAAGDKSGSDKSNANKLSSNNAPIVARPDKSAPDQ